MAESYRSLIVDHQALLLTLVLLFALAAIIFFVLCYLRLQNLRTLYRSALAHKDLAALEVVLLHQADVERALGERVTALELVMERATASARRHIQYCALERYRAFKDVGGDQSFSLALLGGNGDGVILTSIYGRDESRVFAKRVAGGKSTHQLSEEERKVLAAVIGNSGARKKEIPAVVAKS